MPTIASLFGFTIGVVAVNWFSTRVLSGKLDALRAEMKQSLAEFRLEIRADLLDLKDRI